MIEVDDKFSPHGSNLQSKIDENYKGMKEVFKRFYKENYKPWRQKNIGLIGNEKNHVTKRVNWFEEYLDKLNDLMSQSGKRITAQSKFKSSAIEEFVHYLLRDIGLISKLRLKFVNKKVFTGLNISPKGDIEIKTKDIDLALVAEREVSFDSRKELIRVPAIAIEVKTYLDKTMLNEAQFTAQLIKRGNSFCHVYIVAETNAVSVKELPQESPVDEIFIFRKHSDAKIDVEVAYDFVCEVKRSLQNIQKTVIKKPHGRLLHPMSK